MRSKDWDLGRDKDWGTGVGDIVWGNSLGHGLGMWCWEQTGEHSVVTLVGRLRLGDKVGTWAWVRAWGLRLGEPGLVWGVGCPNWMDRTW